jgi:hypothetical protein
MPVLVQARTDDEIADVIEKIRAAKDPEVGVVLPRGNRALQTPLNARLLSQFSKAHGRRTAIVSDEPRVQELARANGFPVYASVPAFERGIELGAPMPPSPNTYRPAAALGGAAAAATALREAPPRTPPTFTPTASGQPPGGDSRRPLSGSGTPPPSRWRDRRRPLYFAGGAVAVIGLLLFFALAPSAKITITVAGTPITKNAVIQGSTDANAARQGDHILTAVINATATSSFAANPSGSAALPATPARATLVFQWSGPATQTVYLPQGQVFLTSDRSISFVSAQVTTLCLGPNNSQATPADCGTIAPNNQVIVQDATAEGKGNVPASSITYWPQDPCSSTNYDIGQCQGPGHDFTLTNPAAASGGADSKQVTVASATDVTNWSTQVTQIENTLTGQLNSQMQSKSGGKSFAVDPGGNGKAIAFDISPKIPNPGDQFAPATITINGTGNAVVYDQADVRNDVIADLNAQVTQGDELAPGKLNMQPCMVTQASADGTVILSCSASDFAQPIVNLAGLKSQLAGKNPGDAQKVIQSGVDKVQGVTVSEFPFRLFYLPFFSSRIEIDENFVAAAPSTP